MVEADVNSVTGEHLDDLSAVFAVAYAECVIVLPQKLQVNGYVCAFAADGVCRLSDSVCDILFQLFQVEDSVNGGVQRKGVNHNILLSMYI